MNTGDNRRRLWAFLPPVLWMGVIYLFSAQTGADSGALSGSLTAQLLSWIWPGWDTLSPAAQGDLLATVGLVIRKGAHVTEFAILGGLAANACARWRGAADWPAAALAALWGLLTAAGDEWHQAYVPGRGPAVTDVLIDFSGVLLGVGIVLLLLRRRWSATNLPVA